MNKEYEKCLEAANYIKEKVDASGAIVIVLGTGLSDLGIPVENPVTIEYKDIPNFPLTTVPGHEGRMVCGTINGTKVLCMKGRYHFYEGYDMKTVVRPIRVMKLLGVKAAILTNAAGSVRENMQPCDLMFVDDFINYMGDNPLLGENIPEFGLRFPDMTKAIDPRISNISKEVAKDLGIDFKSGVYMAFRGPNFETPAEIRFARTFGADAVGMSTVPEIIAARHCGLPVIAISCISNMAAGITGEELTVEEVNVNTAKAKNDFQKLLVETIQKI